jgi:hypothetical protein
VTAATALATVTSTPVPEPSVAPSTTAFAAGGAAAAAVAAAAGVFFIKRGSSAKAQLNNIDPANAIMNPLYEGMPTFDNPIYDPMGMDGSLDDGFEDSSNDLPKA